MRVFIYRYKCASEFHQVPCLGSDDPASCVLRHIFLFLFLVATGMRTSYKHISWRLVTKPTGKVVKIWLVQLNGKTHGGRHANIKDV